MIEIVDLDGRIQSLEFWLENRDRVRDIDIRLRVKFSDILTGLDLLHILRFLRKLHNNLHKYFNSLQTSVTILIVVIIHIIKGQPVVQCKKCVHIKTFFKNTLF